MIDKWNDVFEEHSLHNISLISYSHDITRIVIYINLPLSNFAEYIFHNIYKYIVKYIIYEINDQLIYKAKHALTTI